MQVKHYERLSALKSSRQALGSLSDVRAGDCVIAFSRAQIYAIKVGWEASDHQTRRVFSSAHFSWSEDRLEQFTTFWTAPGIRRLSWSHLFSMAWMRGQLLPDASESHAGFVSCGRSRRR